MARKPENLAAFAQHGIDVRQGNYFDPALLERAFAGVERLMFISTVMFTGESSRS